MMKKKKIHLSTYKLLTEHKTFYEANGFLQISHSIITTPININTILDKILETRTQILTIPIQELISILNVNDASKDIKIKLQIIYEKIGRYTATDTSLSDFFKLFVKSDEPDKNLLEIANLIYHFVNEKLYNILNLLLADLNITISNEFTYIITDDINMYDNIADLYKKYNITRDDEYSKFLGLSIQKGGINIKKKPSTLKLKGRQTNSSARTIKTLKHKTTSTITNRVLEQQAQKFRGLYSEMVQEHEFPCEVAFNVILLLMRRRDAYLFERYTKSSLPTLKKMIEYIESMETPGGKSRFQFLFLEGRFGDTKNTKNN